MEHKWGSNARTTPITLRRARRSSAIATTSEMSHAQTDKNTPIGTSLLSSLINFCIQRLAIPRLPLLVLRTKGIWRLQREGGYAIYPPRIQHGHRLRKMGIFQTRRDLPMHEKTTTQYPPFKIPRWVCTCQTRGRASSSPN